MKTKFLAFILIFSAGICRADSYESDRSSRTTTDETLVRIPGSGPGDVLNRVIVTSCSVTAGDKFSIFNSSGVATSTISLNISLGTGTIIGGNAGCPADYPFFLRVSSAITYSKQGLGEVVILWRDLSKEIP